MQVLLVRESHPVVDFDVVGVMDAVSVGPPDRWPVLGTAVPVHGDLGEAIAARDLMGVSIVGITWVLVIGFRC
jgi:hypothetical protein